MADAVLNVVGWVGTLVVVGSYVFMRAGKIQQEGTFYEACNVVGPIMIAIPAYYLGMYSVVALQAVWFMATLLTWRQNSLETKAKPTQPLD